jgi:hypothetical protein
MKKLSNICSETSEKMLEICRKFFEIAEEISEKIQAVNNDLGWFVGHGTVSLENARYFDEQITLLCGNIAEVSDISTTL